MKLKDIEIGMQVSWQNDRYIVKSIKDSFISIVNDWGSVFFVSPSALKRRPNKRLCVRNLA